MTTPTPSTEVPEQEDQLQKIKVCIDAGFLTTVEVGQYFMTKDTEEFSQFTEPVTCREYTLPRHEKSSDPKGWNRGNTTIGPVLEVTTSYLQGKYGMEIRIQSVNKDNSHSWVRTMDWISWSRIWSTKSTTTTSRKPLRWSLKILASASRPKAKAKPRRRTSVCSSARTLPICERFWTDIEPGTCSNIAFPVSKRLSTLSSWSSTSRRRWGDNSGD